MLEFDFLLCYIEGNKTKQGGGRMLAEERFAVILNLLKKQRAVTVTELAQALDTSESTIRRDLIVLAEQGKLNKVHGGATVCQTTYETGEPPMAAKEQLQREQKDAIARYAAAQIHTDDMVFLDAGSTTLRMLEYLQPGGNTVFVTNGILHAQQIEKKGFKTYILGGLLKVGTEAIVGAQAVQSLAQYNFTKAFIGINGITVGQGYTTPDPEEAVVKATAMQQAYIKYILADSSKFGKVSAVTVAPIGKACIITDCLPDKTYRKHAVIKEVDAT